MTQYIDKSALIAEIDRLQESIKATAIDDRISKEQAEAYKVCVKLRSFVEDTLEVKEVNLEKEFYDFLDKLIGKDNGHLSEDELFSIAEHFFELGLNKAQNVWHDASEKLPTGVIVVNNGGNLHIGWSTDEGDGIEDEHGRLITKTYQKWAREKDLT